MSQSRTQRIALLLVFFAGVGALAEYSQAQTFQYPPYGAQRGRMVARSGLGHSVRYRWGNGLTPTGGAVITNAIDAFAPALIAVAGGSRDFEEEGRARDADRSRAQMCDRLAVAQEEANALLVRTARLVDQRIELVAETQSAPSQQPPGPDSQPPSPHSTGSDPWPNVQPNNGAASGSSVTPVVPDSPGDDPWPSVQPNVPNNE